jgi:hypothetical protein
MAAERGTGTLDDALNGRMRVLHAGFAFLGLEDPWRING